MKLVGMYIVPARNLGNARLSSKALLNKPQLLSRSPSPPSLRTGKNRNRRHVCPLTCKLMGKHSHAPRHPGRWCSPDAYDTATPSHIGAIGEVPTPMASALRYARPI